MERLGYTRLYATVTGTLLVLIGLFGFLASSEFKTPYLTDEMLGFLAVNGWANSFRIVLGLLGLIMATRFSKLYAGLAGVLLLGLGIWGQRIDTWVALGQQVQARDLREHARLPTRTARRQGRQLGKSHGSSTGFAAGRQELRKLGLQRVVADRRVLAA